MSAQADTEALQAFVEQARGYCAFVEEAAAELPLGDRLRTAAIRLSRLYAAGLELPDIEADDGWTEPPEVTTPPRWPGLGDQERYFELFDPYVLDEPVSFTLSGDLLDVYREVRRGLSILEGGAMEAQVLWCFRFGLESHWGDHATDALRVLHRAICAVELRDAPRRLV